MPTKLHLVFDGPPPPDAHVSGTFRHATGVRALLYRCLAQSAPALALELHDFHGPKPLTASPLWWRGGRWELEVAVLIDDALPALLSGMPAVGERVRFGPEEFALTDLVVGPTVRYEAFGAEAGDWRTLHIDFLTPTAFQQTLLVAGPEGTLRKQRKVTPLPDPALAAAAWWHRWNAMMDLQRRPHLPERVLDVLPLLAVARSGGHTECVRLDGTRPFIGFVGRLVAHLLARDTLAPDLVAALGALAHFANYSGTGVETLRGLGQTRVTLHP